MRARLFFRRALDGSGRAGRVSLAAAAFLLLGGVGLRADIQDPNAPHAKGAKQQRRELPANGVPVAESIDQGASVEIVLRARGQLGKWVDFSVHSQPEHGTLDGPPRQLSRTAAAVIYTHRADDGPGQDTFSYSVQAAGSAVSAPVEVKITIRDTPPTLVATPAELDFGAVKVGDTSGADLTLENRGGGEAIGRLSLPPPWVVEGSADYRLGRGQRQTFHILFGPKSGRSFSETMGVVAESGAPTHLLGTGLGAPGELEALENGALATRVTVFGPSSGIGGIGGTGPGSGPNPGLAVRVTPAPVTVAEAAPPRLGSSAKPAGADPMEGMQAPEDDTVGPANTTPLDSSGYINLNDTGVKQFRLRHATRSTLDVSWKPLVPAPKLYRVELRYLAADDDGTKLRIDWRPYAQVDIRTGMDICLATVRGLPAGARQTLRVVAIDATGHVAGGSATLQATTLPPLDFWRITPLRILVAALLLCVGLIIRRRWEERQILREIDESRAAARAASANYILRP
jgi:hypothetical protein